MNREIDSVRNFWDTNPLWSGESSFEPGTLAFFEEHSSIYINDCFAGKLDEKIFKLAKHDGKILDLGCGVGFWLVEFGKRAFKNLVGADISTVSLHLAKRRCELYNIEVTLHEENAEKTNFSTNYFDHVNCLGVIHHSPDPEAILKEIQRILRPGGTATISVYHMNFLLRHWTFLKPLGQILGSLGAKLVGRERENIFFEKDAKELVRLYDGKDNPIGIAFDETTFRVLLKKYFPIDDIFYHFFPARSLPIQPPRVLHQLLDKYIPFMMYASVKKAEQVP